VNDALTTQPNVQVDSAAPHLARRDFAPGAGLRALVYGPVKSPADLFTREFIVGAAGATSSLAILPTVLNHVLGTKFRIVEDTGVWAMQFSPSSAASCRASAPRMASLGSMSS